MNRYGKRCVLYPRVSTEMQVDGYSLEGQKTMLTRFADREEMVIVDTYEDAGKSGKSIEGRPAFQKMLRDIEEGLDIDYVLVYKLSRFGRNAADILNSLELIQSYGVNLICIEEGIDSSQTSGKLLISVLSAVAEIERENIIEQTMNGRREKARQGGWNGGFAPYGYALVDNKLVIAEAEAVAIRRIFELYTSSEIGLGGVANQLNLEGIRKIPRQNGTLEDWTGHFIKLILDNPVYYGKIAYGRRTKEKVKGTKNDYQMKRNDDYILTDGQHEGIVSEEVWEKAHAKRLRTGVKQPSKIGRDRVHLLSGLLKCPVCGSPMYTNKHAWTNKDGTYKEVYYYVCSRNRMVRGKHCEYKAMLKKNDIEPMVIEAIREIVRNKEYAQAIKKRIGVQIDTKAVDKELEGYRAKLKEVDLNKSRLEREIDNLPIDTKYRERKLHDMALRLDSLYDIIVELEEKIEDAMMRRDAIAQQAITLEGIYKIMVNFDCVYNIISDEEKRAVVTALIKEIELYRNDESECPLKRIGLNFPVFKDGKEVSELLWDKGNTVDTHALLQWVLDNEDACDVLIVSMDQLLSGGLVNSRWEDGTDLTWEKDAIDTLSQIAARKPVYVFDTVMRLATTAGYQGLDSEAYRLFRSYGMAERGELTGHNLTVDNIIAGYPYGADGERIETTLDDELVEHYLAARARKLRLTDYLLRHAESFAACVVGVDDSAARISVQTNEIRYLQRLLGKNCALFCGTDELGMMAFTRAYADCAGWNSRLSVHYFGGYEDSVADAYDTSTLRESVEQHITALGAELADWSEQSDAVVLVLTRGASSTECSRYLAAWEDNCRNGVPTIVIDASSATQHLPQQLEDTSLQWLMGYSAWGTAANSVGIALSMGLTRLQWLQGEQDPQPEDSEAFARELIFAYMKDIAYCRYCRPTIKDLTPEGIEQALLRQNMTTRVETALKDTALVTGPDGVTDYVIPEFRLTDFSAPLGRSYEIRFRILFPNAGPWITEQ